jgi:RND family efflux transporter MFP subunit
MMKWGGMWARLLLEQKMHSFNDRLANVLTLVASCLEFPEFQAATTALATELAVRLSCERVSFGFLKGKHIDVVAISHSAHFEKKSNLVSNISEAMDEACDQSSVIVFPVNDTQKVLVTRGHGHLSRREGAGNICTIPLCEKGRIYGAVTLERPSELPFDGATIELCERVASLAGPVLELKRQQDKLLIHKITDSFRQQISGLFGPKHPGLKLVGAALLLVALYSSFASHDYKVTATAGLEGKIQRVVVAPMDGFVAEAHVRAGDLVHEGDALSALEDKDLKLEHRKITSQREQSQKEYRSALSRNDRSEVAVLSARIDEYDAQIELLDEQLSRTHITAPFDGVIISGDLSQSLGSPVERGQVLFEVAPLNEYRVILEVDERDISNMAVGQNGQLVLSSMPGSQFPFAISKITPISSSEEGNNYFRVEGNLEVSSEKLRPGMEGVAKVSVGPRRLVWIWTHTMLDWLRLAVWSWWP